MRRLSCLTLLSGLLLSLSFVLQADTLPDPFAARVAAADTAAATPSGQAYQQQLQQLLSPRTLGFMLKKCSMTTGMAPEDFTLVANISAFRTIQDYQSLPVDKLTQCVGARLSGVCFPWIPAEAGRQSYPIALRMTAASTKGIVIKKGERLRLPNTCPGF